MVGEGQRCNVIVVVGDGGDGLIHEAAEGNADPTYHWTHFGFGLSHLVYTLAAAGGLCWLY